ncbi:hypothetical protein TNCT_503791 [Trichonephila clavata]|uniref:Uncharacterized protein n=1 Tax=Trichonephila clavata TaxID=2740835 RepID=A0A8X6GN37_TRICU|nr:hypothetical protein TNCT_503791 [Trichonephila clavata]
MTENLLYPWDLLDSPAKFYNLVIAREITFLQVSSLLFARVPPNEMKFTNNRDSQQDPFAQRKAGVDEISFLFRTPLSRLETEVPWAASRIFHFPSKRLQCREEGFENGAKQTRNIKISQQILTT